MHKQDSQPRDELTCNETGHVFFRVVNDNPGVIQQGGSDFDSGDVVVKFLPFLVGDADTKSFLVTEPLTPEFHTVSKDALLRTFSDASAWVRGPTECYSVADIDVEDRLAACRTATAMRHVTSATIADDMELNSFDLPHDSEFTRALKMLQKAGVVDIYVETARVTSWRWALEGLNRLQTTWALGSPASLFEPRSGIPINDMSVLDMIGQLEKNKWQMQVWDRYARDSHGDAPPPVEVATRRPKIWWVQTGRNTVSKPYLKCLLRLEDMKVDQVHHLQDNSHYNDLLGKKAPRPKGLINNDSLDLDAELLALDAEARGSDDENQAVAVAVRKPTRERTRAKANTVHPKTHVLV